MIGAVRVVVVDYMSGEGVLVIEVDGVEVDKDMRRRGGLNEQLIFALQKPSILFVFLAPRPRCPPCNPTPTLPGHPFPQPEKCMSRTTPTLPNRHIGASSRRSLDPYPPSSLLSPVFCARG